MLAYSVSRSCFVDILTVILSISSLCECNEYKLCPDNKVQVLCRLIGCYNITGTSALGIAVYCRFFNIPLTNTPRVVREVCGSLSSSKGDEEPLVDKKAGLDRRV